AAAGEVSLPARSVARPLAADRMLAVLPSGHELSVRPSLPVAELARHPFIMSTGGCEPLITAIARAAGASLKCHYRVRDTNSILAMVAEGLGLSIVPELSLPAHLSGVHAIPLEPAAERIILLALPADPLPAAVAFAELAAAHHAASR
ncbi:LysR family transcriptional regulator substrate-binding protein, partial [Nonomuraea sp. NPDC001684]